jgi:hypothetical protein
VFVPAKAGDVFIGGRAVVTVGGRQISTRELGYLGTQSLAQVLVGPGQRVTVRTTEDYAKVDFEKPELGRDEKKNTETSPRSTGRGGTLAVETPDDHSEPPPLPKPPSAPEVVTARAQATVIRRRGGDSELDVVD